jgi:hypothetical protein
MRIKINLKKLPLVVLATLLTSVVLTLLIIALPQTERLLSQARFDLNSNSANYWKKVITLKLDIKNQDLPFKDQKIAETERILYSRLNSYDVEEVTIERIDGEKENNPLLKVTVQSSTDPNTTLPLIQQRYFMRIVTRKEGVDFDSEENQFAVFDPANYEQTPFTRRFFRNVYLTKLPSTSGEDSYFAIFKTNLLTAAEFDEFVSKNAGRTAGLQVDNFVTPITIPIPTPSQNGISTKPVFSVGLNITDAQYRSNDLLMNAGVIPVAYTVEQTDDLQPQVYSINYIQLTLALAATLLATAIYFIFRKEYASLATVILPLGLLVSGWLAYMKLTQTPADLFIMVLQFGFLYILALILSSARDSKYLASVVIAGFFGLLHYFGIGYIRGFALEMIVLIAALHVSIWFSGIYISILRRTTSR